MAARNFTEQAHTMQRGVVKLFVKATRTAASGAETLTLTQNPGSAITSIACDAAGVITVTLADKYTALLGCNVDVGHATAATIKAGKVYFTSESVASAKTITLTYCTTAAGAADLPQNTILFFDITLKNTSR